MMHRRIAIDVFRVLSEGGAVGHLAHVYENLELTFAEIRDIIDLASEGKLEKVSEKIDGMNLVFTYDLGANRLLAARSGGDIKGGGMDAAQLAKKFAGRGSVEDAFVNAFKVLTQAISGLSDGSKKKIFGTRANKWYSMEVIYTANPGTINYDSNSIVFHGWPVFDVSQTGEVTRAASDVGINELARSIEQMQRAVKAKDWRVHGPALLSMKRFADGSIRSTIMSMLDQAMSRAGVSDGDTIYDYMRNLLIEEIKPLGLGSKLSLAVIDRVLNRPGAMTVTELKRGLKPDVAAKVSEFVKSSEALKKQLISPIERVIHRLAVESLNGLRSTLIDKSDDEVMRLRAEVTRAIKRIEASGNEVAMEFVKREMQRLGSIEDINAPMEGIVFFYKGQAYKFTGSFAPTHQIISLLKYGRKGIDPATL